MTSDPSRLLPAVAPLSPDEEPTTLLLRALRHIATAKTDNAFSSASERRMALYLVAVADLAGTCEDPKAVYARMSQTLPHSSTRVNEATADELRRTTLAFHGLACDRQGLSDLEPSYPRSLSAWLRAADEALALYVRTPKN